MSRQAVPNSAPVFPKPGTEPIKKAIVSATQFDELLFGKFLIFGHGSVILRKWFSCF